MPRPVVRPILPLISWMTAINGYVKRRVHVIAKPNCAPAWEYVAIPLGSSSDAPVMRPGPRTLRRRGLLGPTAGLAGFRDPTEAVFRSTAPSLGVRSFRPLRAGPFPLVFMDIPHPCYGLNRDLFSRNRR